MEYKGRVAIVDDDSAGLRGDTRGVQVGIEECQNNVLTDRDVPLMF